MISECSSHDTLQRWDPAPLKKLPVFLREVVGTANVCLHCVHDDDGTNAPQLRGRASAWNITEDYTPPDSECLAFEDLSDPLPDLRAG